MKCTVNDQVINIKKVKVRAFNFGQHWRTAFVVTEKYELFIEFSYFDDYYRKRWHSYMREHITDEEDALDVEITKCNNPAIDDILTNPLNFENLIKLLLECDGHDMLLSILGDIDDNQDCIIINTIDNVSIQEEGLVLNGEFRRNWTGHFYQDY